MASALPLSLVSAVQVTESPLTWFEVLDSSQHTVYRPEADDVFHEAGASAPNSWTKIQDAWGGAAQSGELLYIWGGGHADGAHNGLLAVEPATGQWQRITEPSPLWREEDCPDGICPAVTGPCAFNNCNTGPDGRPVSRHTYGNLAADDQYLYSSGGSIWRSGKVGEGPNNWRFNLESREWEPFADSGLERVNGNLVYAHGELYQLTAHGYGIYNIAREEWRFVLKERAFNARSSLIYDPASNRLFLIGDGVFKYVGRHRFGETWHDLPPPPSEALMGSVAPGLAVVDGLLIAWAGGSDLQVLDTSTLEWHTVSPEGSPGVPLNKGTYGRFALVDGHLVLVNGTHTNMFRLGTEAAPGDKVAAIGDYLHDDPRRATREDSDDDVGPVAYTPPAAPVTPDPDPPVEDPPSETPLPTGDILAHPRFTSPAAEQVVSNACGPMSEWQRIVVRSDDDLAQLRQLDADDRVRVEIQWREEAYEGVYAKRPDCIAVIGISGPDGQKPLVMNVNATASSNRGLRRGGLWAENLRVSPGDVQLERGLTNSGDCIGVPNDRQFLILRDLDVSGCPHHAFLVDDAYQMYLEVADSNFEQASSHLAYIDRVAYAHIHDSTFQSPGWGHALRCIAATCHIENVRMSNVQLDGSVLPRGGTTGYNQDRNYVGMHPLEVYTCGGSHVVRNSEITYLNDSSNSAFAASFRWREGMNTCNLGGPVEEQWLSMPWGGPAWSDPTVWQNIPDIDLTIDGLAINCPNSPCQTWDVRSSYPVMNDGQKARLRKWLQDGSFEDWDSLLAAAQAEPMYLWAAERVLPSKRQNFLEARFPNKVPLPVPEYWRERAHLLVRSIEVDNPGEHLLRPPQETDYFCWDFPHTPGECSLQLPRGHITLP